MARFRGRWSRAGRKLASILHLYVGLSAGLLLIVLGVTGSALVYRDEIDELLHPELLRVDPGAKGAPLEDVLAAAREHASGSTPSFVRLPREASQSVEVWTDGEEGPRVYVDPYRATALGSLLPEQTLTGFLFELHVDLFAGEPGHVVAGLSALLLLLLLATGLVLWWPRTGGWGRAVGVRWRGPWRRANYDLHRASGIWTGAGLFVLALTGASLVFHDAFSAAIHRLTASDEPPPPPASVVRPGAPDAPFAVAFARAEEALPGGRFTWVYLPTTPDAPLALRKRLPGELHPNGRSYVYLDRHTGAVLHAHDATAAQVGTRIYDVLYPLHIGRFGAWSKALYALLGLMPLVLAVGGTLIWWDRRRRKRARVRVVSTIPNELRPERSPAMKISRIASLALLLPLHGCIGAGEAASKSATEVTVDMSEFAFAASERVFEVGVPYRFILRNRGSVAHEWAIVPRGDTDESRLLFEVEEDDLPPGATVTVEYTFQEPGAYDFACYMEGHYAGGMVLPVEVRARS